MRFPKVLFFDCETLALDSKVASIRELAFIAEVEGVEVGRCSYKIQPIFHADDMLYGHIDINEFCNVYNKKYHKADFDRLLTFGFKKESPLFFYSKSALTFNVEPPYIRNPADWLIEKDLISAKKALLFFDENISQFDLEGKWVLAGHNIKYDYNVLSNWVRRLLPKDGADRFLDKFNNFIFLDTLDLARWMQWSGRLQSQQATLTVIAKELGLPVDNCHTAIADVENSYNIAKILLERKLLGQG